MKSTVNFQKCKLWGEKEEPCLQNLSSFCMLLCCDFSALIKSLCTYLLFMMRAGKLQVVGTLYTHHQKLIIMDTQGTGGNSRKLTSFIGGLDLCDGRWDTPTHSMFATLQTLHKNDYHNPTFTVSFLSPRSLRRCGNCPSFLFLRDSD
jgi:hypothetical protein